MSLHPAALTTAELLTQCELRRQRRSGPGGQHRNKVETAIFLTHRPTGITAAASERRSQEENRLAAVFRLRVKLAVEQRGEFGKCAEQGPSGLWQSRLRGKRIKVNPEHDDFPTLLAEALDVTEACGFALAEAAARLRTTGSQLVGLLSHEPAALQWVNKRRAELGLRPLRGR